MGVFEEPPFDQGTIGVAHAVARLPIGSHIVGGGDSVAAIAKAGVAIESHISQQAAARPEF
jgi:phosphoglycerate kinase